MRKNKFLLLFLMLLIALVSFSGCKTTGKNIDAEVALAAIAPPMPAIPLMEPVRFEPGEGGLWLSYNDYRTLERNVIAMREYAARLEIIIKFYRGE